MGLLLIAQSGSIPAANRAGETATGARTASRLGEGNADLVRVVRAAGRSPATRPDPIRVASGRGLVHGRVRERAGMVPG